MLTNLGHVLTDDIVVNYKSNDRDECLHFLTDIDSSCKDLGEYISPSAKKIYTSNYNAWFLKQRLNIVNPEIFGFKTDVSYKLTYKENVYIFSFIDSKFATGSVALLLHGAFGCYLYTGNFSYYSDFVKSPVLLPVIAERALTRLYLDNTYHEQSSDFLGLDELTDKIAKIIRSEPKKHIYLYADRVNMCPLLAEIASKLKEKVYLCYNTIQIMEILGHDSLFTGDASKSRIFIDKAYIKKRGHDYENISIKITRHEKPNQNSEIFPQNERKGNSYHFHYYSHTNNKEICELLLMLKPESTTGLFSDLDNSKVNYNLDFKPDAIQTRLFKSLSDKSTLNLSSIEGIVKNNEESNVSTKCPLRVRKVPEINNDGLYNETTNRLIGTTNRSFSNVALPNKESISMNNNTSVNEEMAYTDLTSNNLGNPITSENLHNYCKTKQTSNSIVEDAKSSNSSGNGFTQANVSIDRKHPSVPKKLIPLVMDRKLVKENTVTIAQNKLIRLPKVITTDKKSILLHSNYISSKNSPSVELSADSSKSNNLDSENTVIKSVPCSTKTRYKALHQPHSKALNMSSLYGGWMGNNSIPGLSSSSETPESVNNSEKALTEIISQNCIPDQELLEREADETEVGKENALDSSSRNQDLQTNNKIGAIYEVSLDDTNLFHSANNNGSISNKTNLSFMDEDFGGTTERQSSPVDCSSSMSKTAASSSKPVESADSSSSNDVTKSCMQYIDIANSVVSKCSSFTNVESITEDIKIKKVERIKKKCSKRALSVLATDDESTSCKKKLRSDNIRMCLFHPNDINKDMKLNMKHCHVLLKRNDVERSYFFSSYHKCHLPKFCGFKKHEVRPRQHVLHLRNLKKIIEQSCSK